VPEIIAVVLYVPADKPVGLAMKETCVLVPPLRELDVGLNVSQEAVAVADQARTGGVLDAAKRSFALAGAVFETVTDCNNGVVLPCVAEKLSEEEVATERVGRRSMIFVTVSLPFAVHMLVPSKAMA